MTRKKSNKGFILFGYSIYHPINIILLFNCVVYIIQSIAESDQMLTYRLLNGFALNPSLAVDGYYWQILTYGFLHSTGGFLPLHLLMNMYGFYLLGSYIEPIIGKLKLTFLYFSAHLLRNYHSYCQNDRFYIFYFPYICVEVLAFLIYEPSINT